MGLVKPTGMLGELAKIRGEGRRSPTLLIPPMKERALGRAAEPDQDRDSSVIHPSEMCKQDWCIRATYWRITGRTSGLSSFNWTRENIFEKGNYTHAYFQDLLTDTGELFGSWRCRICGRWADFVCSKELPCTKPCAYYLDEQGVSRHVNHMWEYKEVRLRGGPHNLIAGKADAGFRDTIGEFKTVGIGTVRVDAPKMVARFYHKDLGIYDLDGLWKQLARPFASHVRQGNTYLYLAREMGLPFTAVNYVYEFKPNQQTKEFRVTYSEEIMAPLLLRANLIADAIYEDGKPPACEFGGCEQCRSYENDKAEPERAARRVIASRPAEAGAAETGRAPRETGSQPAPARRGVNRPSGPRVDAADGKAGQVVEIPRVSAQRSGGRRTVLRPAS